MKKKPPADPEKPKRKRVQPTPIVLPIHPCEACGHSHPKPKQRAPEGTSPFLTVATVAGFLGSRVSSIYSEKSRGKLPPCLPGKKNPMWDPCVVAIFLYEGRVVGPTIPLPRK